jgi:hypothetical protein
MNILELSAVQLRQAAELKEKLEAAQAELASILAGGCAGECVCAPAAPAAAPGKKLHWTQTPEGKARIAKIAKAGWRKRRR